jgi:hypothetical protein
MPHHIGYCACGMEELNHENTDDGKDNEEEKNNDDKVMAYINENMNSMEHISN